MQTRRDRLQAYRFGTRRTVASLLAGDPDAPEAPLRRVAAAVVAGVVLGALIVAAVGIYGLLVPGGAKSWRDGQSLVAEKETGTRYVYVGGVLHPVLNLASARLIMGQTNLKLTRVSRSSLAGTPHGLPVGIAGAPDSMPAAADLLTSPWSVCAEPARKPDGGTVPHTEVLLTRLPAGVSPVPADRGVLVADGDGPLYLVWRGQRLRAASRTVSAALGWSNGQAVPVGAAWLDAVPSGPDLLPPAVAALGHAGPAVAAAPGRVGQVLLVSNVDVPDQYYVLLVDGLSPISPLQAGLLLGDPATRAAYPGASVAPVRIGAAQAAAVPRSATALTAPQAYPARVPPLIEAAAGGTALCAVDTGADAADPAVTMLAGPTQAAPADSATLLDPVAHTPLADAVRVPPGRGAVVRAVPAPGVAGTLYLITDLGYKYPLPDAQVLNALGYPGQTPVPVSVGIVNAVPSGPALDPAVAARTVSGAPPN